MTATRRLPISTEYRSLAGRVRVRTGAALAAPNAITGPSQEVTLVHAISATGNLFIGPDASAVLDWEARAILAIRWRTCGWICVNSGGSGEIDKPVAGFFWFARDRSLVNEETGARSIRSRDVLGSDGPLPGASNVLRHDAALSPGPDHSVERAMIGRALVETEIDLLRLAGASGMIRKSGNRFSDQIMPKKYEENNMQDEPTPTELNQGGRRFLRNEITPRIKGHNAFKLRVASTRSTRDAATDAG